MAELEDDEQLSPLEDESERPTLGARIAGTAPPPVMAAAPDAPPPMPKPNIDMSKMPDAVKMLTGPASIPTPPTGSNNPQLAELAKKQASLSAPINPVDPSTGKTKPQYKMGILSRILGGVADFGQGFGGHGGPSVYIGPGATNQRFAREEKQRQGELEGVNTQIGTQEKLDTENERMYRDAIRQAYDTQLGEKNVALGRAAEENAGTRSSLVESQRLLNEARANKANQDPPNKIGDAAAQRTALADQMKLKGVERKDYILTGKLPKEFTDPNQPKRGSKFDFDKIEKDKQKALKGAEKNATAALAKLNKPPTALDPEFRDYIANPKGWHEAKKQEIYERLEKEKDQAQSDYEARIQEKGGAVSSGQQPAARASVQPAKPATSKIDPKNLPQQVMVGGKLRKVAGWNSTTNKVILAPE